MRMPNVLSLLKYDLQVIFKHRKFDGRWTQGCKVSILTFWTWIMQLDYLFCASMVLQNASINCRALKLAKHWFPSPAPLPPLKFQPPALQRATDLENGSLNLQCKICNRLHPSHVNIATCRANTYLVCRILPVVWCIQNDSLSPAHTALMTPYILPQKRQIPSSGHSSSPSLHITSPSRFESWRVHWHTGTMFTNWHGNSIEYVWRICIPEVLK